MPALVSGFPSTALYAVNLTLLPGRTRPVTVALSENLSPSPTLRPLTAVVMVGGVTVTVSSGNPRSCVASRAPSFACSSACQYTLPGFVEATAGDLTVILPLADAAAWPASSTTLLSFSRRPAFASGAPPTAL